MVVSRRAVVALVLVSWIGAVAASSPVRMSTGRAATNQPEITSLSSLAVIEAGGGTFAAGSGRLTLTDVTPRAVGFTDHPARQADSYDVATVFSLLFNGQTPPDAALEYDHGSGHRVTILEISKPSYDGDSGTLKLHAKILDHPENELHPGSALVDFASRQDRRLPSSFTAPTLFVDSGLTAGKAQPSATASGGNCEPRNYLAEFDVYLSAVCTFEGTVKPWSPVDHDVRCSDFEDPPYKGFPQYIERRPNDPPTIADQPRIDKHDTPTRKVHISWVATDSDFNQLLSRRVTAIRISLGTSPLYGDQHYKVSVWCGTVNGAWIIAG